MVQDFQSDKILEGQIREIYARVVWTHKTQEKCADIIWVRHKRIKIWQIILSALTTTGILVTVFGDNKVVGIVSALCSAILLVLNSYTKDYDLGEIAQKHIAAASTLWDARESYLSLLVDLKANLKSKEEIIERRDNLQEKLFKIYAGAPRTISKAYKEATKGLQLKEELTFSDDEIDLLLPKHLRNG